MDDHLFSNLIAYSAQLAAIAGGGTLLLLLLRVHAPSMRYGYWRALLAVCLVLPWVQGRQAREIVPPAVTVSSFEVDVVMGSVAAGAPLPPPSVPIVDWMAAGLLVLAGGALVRLAWMGVSLWRLRTLRTAGVAAPPCADHDELQRALGTRADIRYIPNLGQPVTFGLRRPVVLLPESLRTHSLAVQRAVLCHELLHVQRRDWAWVLAEELVRAAFWFHPAMWWIVSRVQLAREEIVDELAILATRSRRSYIEALLAFADGTPLAPAPAFLRRRHLFRRILLISKETAMSPRRVVFSCLVMLCTVVAGSWYAVNAFPLQQAPTRAAAPADAAAPVNPLPAPTFTVMPEYPAATPPSFDAFAASVPPSQAPRSPGVVATNPRALTPDALSPRGGNRTPAPARMTIALNAVEPADAVAEPGGTVPASAPSRTAASAAQSPTPSSPTQGRAGEVTPSAPPPAPRAPVRVGGNVTPPRKIKDVKPVYPEDAKAAKVRGVVIIEATIDETGQVRAARAIRSIPLLDDAALGAVRQWEFTPTLLNGVPTPIIMSVTVNFTLASEGPSASTPEPASPANGQAPASNGTRLSPQRTKYVAPVYPPAAAAARVQGTVVVEAKVDEHGRVASAIVLRSVPMLDQAALDAVQQWEYAPTVVNGTAIPVIVIAMVPFGEEPPASPQITGGPFSPPQAAPQASSSAPAVNGQTPLRVGGDIPPPKKIKDVKPLYPAIAQSARVSGIVIIETTIDEAGRVAEARVIRSVPLLDQAALDAVKGWEFTPTIVNGVPVRVVMSVTVNFQLDPTPVQASPPSDGPLVDGQRPIRVGGNIAPPRKVRDMPPVYPAEAIEQRVSGLVIVETTIDTRGRVVNARILRSIPLLDEAALNAVRQWEFTPTLLNGKPVPVIMSTSVNFTGTR